MKTIIILYYVLFIFVDILNQKLIDTNLTLILKLDMVFWNFTVK